MSNKLNSAILLLSLFVFSVFAIYYYVRTNQIEKGKEYFENRVRFLENEITTIEQHFKLNLATTFNGECLNDLKLINESGDSITLESEISRTGFNLVVLLSKETCYDCLEKQLPIIAKSDFNKLILTDYRSINELRVIKRKYNILNETYRLGDHVDMERFQSYKDSPIIFVVDGNLNILSSFVTYKHLVDYTELYLGLIPSNL